MLKLIKEYIDAKADYDRYGLGVQSGPLSPSVSLTPSGQAIKDRYLAAEKAINEAIVLESAVSVQELSDSLC